MTRNRPRQHVRRTSTGKRILVNKGVASRPKTRTRRAHPSRIAKNTNFEQVLTYSPPSKNSREIALWKTKSTSGLPPEIAKRINGGGVLTTDFNPDSKVESGKFIGMNERGFSRALDSMQYHKKQYEGLSPRDYDNMIAVERAQAGIEASKRNIREIERKQKALQSVFGRGGEENHEEDANDSL